MGTVGEKKAGLCWQERAAMVECPDAKLKRAPSPCLVFVGWLKPSLTNHVLEGEISPTRGRPAAHPAPPPLQSSRGSSHCNPAEPSKTISSIQKWHFPLPFMAQASVCLWWHHRWREVELLIQHESIPLKITAPLPPRERYCLHHL